MNVDFEDPQVTQRVSKILFDLYKEESNGKNRQNSHTHTDTDLHYVYDQVKGRLCFVEAV